MTNNKNDSNSKNPAEILFHPKFVGNSPKLLNALKIAEKLKGTGIHLLIQGETGTGKKTLARYIHCLENNPNRPFIEVSCADLTEQSFESLPEITQHQAGVFEFADGGDLFLDEVDCLKTELQQKLLHAIQKQETRRISSFEQVKINVRLISSAKTNLEKAVKEKKFRNDLYFRLNVVSVDLPPLRDRISDLPKLAAHFLDIHYKGKTRKHFTREAAKTLKSYKWPGNILELESVIQYCLIYGKEDTISNQTVHDAINAQNSGKKKNKSNEEIYEI